MKRNKMNYFPPPPSQRAFRSISECRVRSSFQLFNGKKLLIHTHTAPQNMTTYYIESINNTPCVVTYVNNKRVDIRELCDDCDQSDP